MRGNERVPDPGLLASAHALAFLVLGNAVGALLALLLLFPGLGDALAPLTYGRWASVHLDVLLYGWGSLPLVALLFAFFDAGASPRASRLARLAVHAWSAMLLIGCVSWLAGQSSGKPFLDWIAGARVLLVVAMLLLWAALLVAFLQGRASGSASPRARAAGRAALLLVLLPVPFVLAWAASPSVYPAINPDSGGPTGGSLLGSVLGMAMMFLITPWMLGLERRGRVVSWIAAGALALHSIAFLLLDHGNHSHHEAVQVAALASTLLWPPLLALHLRGFAWPRESRPWLLATLGWGVALAISGVVAFLPGTLESWKFTHALVAHAHLALAGLVTAWNLALLTTLLPGTRLAALLSSSRSVAAWNAGLLVHVIALAGLASIETRAVGGLLPGASAASALMGLRLAGGLAQLAVSVGWLLGALREGEAGATIAATGSLPSLETPS